MIRLPEHITTEDRAEQFVREALYTFEVMSRGRVVRLLGTGGPGGSFIPSVGHRRGCMDGVPRDTGALCNCGVWESYNQRIRAKR